MNLSQISSGELNRTKFLVRLAVENKFAVVGENVSVISVNKPEINSAQVSLSYIIVKEIIIIISTY